MELAFPQLSRCLAGDRDKGTINIDGGAATAEPAPTLWETTTPWVSWRQTSFQSCSRGFGDHSVETRATKVLMICARSVLIVKRSVKPGISLLFLGFFRPQRSRLVFNYVLEKHKSALGLHNSYKYYEEVRRVFTKTDRKKGASRPRQKNKQNKAKGNCCLGRRV